MECEKCHAEIGNASYCGCGWKRRTKSHDAPREFVQCAHMACNTRAEVRIKTATGWAKLCLPHLADHAQIRADNHCQTLGLDAPEKQRAWLKENTKAKWLQEALVQHEPGEDWGEQAA